MMLALYSNIKRLRKQNNMSQQELAEAVGYKGKSMIAQVENGKVDLSASMISKFADVFHVSELELMGLNEIGVTNSSLPAYEQLRDYYVKSAKAKELYEQFESLTPDKQAVLLNYLQFLRSQP